MDNHTGKLTGYFPLFDHDRAFCENPRTFSQTAREPMSLREAALEAQRELRMDLSPLDEKNVRRSFPNSSGRSCWPAKKSWHYKKE